MSFNMRKVYGCITNGNTAVDTLTVYGTHDGPHNEKSMALVAVHDGHGKYEKVSVILSKQDAELLMRQLEVFVNDPR